MKKEIIETLDGSKTLFVPDMQEQYHSINGAFTESQYVFIEKGYTFHKSATPVIFEVGFGTGLNALLTANLAEKQERKTKFISIEKYPLDNSLIDQLNYQSLFPQKTKLLHSKIHNAPWGQETKISAHFSLLKIKGDLTTFKFGESIKPDIVYFDAFGPEKQPKMWELKILKRIYDSSALKAVFVTYSAKGEIKRRLINCGYSVERLPGPPGKRHMLRGTKK